MNIGSPTKLEVDVRKGHIIEVFGHCFGDGIASDPSAWRIKFRKMARSPFAFYRGSACLFYSDLTEKDEAFTDEKTRRVWIQGDLHAENFGTYMNSAGTLVFDVNDFDEAYVAPYTWDIKRLAASLALIGYEKALSDDEIREVIERLSRSYVSQVAVFAEKEGTDSFALTMANAKGRLLRLLQQSRLETRSGMLAKLTEIKNFERRFKQDDLSIPVDQETRKRLVAAFEGYVQTIPEGKRANLMSYKIKDVVGRRGMGVGSAGFVSYNFLLEGNTEALENDIMIYMKPSQQAAPSRAMEDQRIKDFFIHDGHRTIVSQRALQSFADPWIGYTTLDNVGYMVAELSPYMKGLNWAEINRMDEMLEVMDGLGQAVAKIHCISDADSDHSLVPFSIDKAILEILTGREEEFVSAMAEFGCTYGDVVRNDHRIFVDAFRNHEFNGL